MRLLSDPANPASRTGTYARELDTIEGYSDTNGNKVPGLAELNGYRYNPATTTYEPIPTTPSQVFTKDPTILLQPSDKTSAPGQ